MMGKSKSKKSRNAPHRGRRALGRGHPLDLGLLPNPAAVARVQADADAVVAKSLEARVLSVGAGADSSLAATLPVVLLMTAAQNLPPEGVLMLADDGQPLRVRRIDVESAMIAAMAKATALVLQDLPKLAAPPGYVRIQKEIARLEKKAPLETKARRKVGKRKASPR